MLLSTAAHHLKFGRLLFVTIIASSSRPFELQRKLQTVSKMEKTMDNYSKDIKTICSQLSSIESPISERMKVFAAFHGFGREYEPIKTTIKSSMDSYPPPTFENVVPRLTSYEDRPQSYTDQSSVTPHLAFYSNRRRGDSHRGIGRGHNCGFYSYLTKDRGFHQHFSPSFLGSRFSIHVMSAKYVENLAIKLFAAGTSSTTVISPKKCHMLWLLFESQRESSIKYISSSY